MSIFRLLPILFALSACGGTDNPSADPTVTRTEAVKRLESRIAKEPISNPAALPVGGRASYDGFMRADLPTGANGARRDYIGDLEIDVNFAAARDEVAGLATGFQTGGGDRLKGRLVLSGGDLYRDTNTSENYTFTGNVAGTLKRNDAPYRIDAKIEGEFRGKNQQAVSGLLFGDVVGPAGQDIFDGSFAAERRDE